MDKIAVVTGANLGIGRATVDSLLQAGWDVFGFDLTEPETPPDTSSGATYRHLICDVANPANITAAFEAVGRQTDTIGAVVCNAGVTIIGELTDISVEEVDKTYEINFRGPWLTIRGALPLLQKNATVDDPSRVVVIGSGGGLRPKVGNGIYSALKQAVHTVANIFAVELAASGVIVNTIAPGTVDTRMSKGAAAAGAKAGSKFRVSGPSPLGRIAKPQDIANAVMFFVSDQAKFINGTVLAVDGGARAAYSGVTQEVFKN
jgi:NAD(P)-dependent dehydrogenase (short-subunit alcohol dehydrogenase family)